MADVKTLNGDWYRTSDDNNAIKLEAPQVTNEGYIYVFKRKAEMQHIVCHICKRHITGKDIESKKVCYCSQFVHYHCLQYDGDSCPQYEK